jgi:hypothetical protein
MARNYFAAAAAAPSSSDANSTASHRGHDRQGVVAGDRQGAVAGFVQANWLLVLHHLGLVLVFIPIANWTALGHYVTGRLLLTEFSNIFIYTRWWVRWAGWKGGWVDLLNSIMLLLSWWITRVWVFPALYLQLAKSRGLPLQETVAVMRWHCHAGSACILLPQVYWFGLMLQAVWKAVRQTVQQAIASGRSGGPLVVVSASNRLKET